jgi:hypothetical protein
MFVAVNLKHIHVGYVCTMSLQTESHVAPLNPTNIYLIRSLFFLWIGYSLSVNLTLCASCIILQYVAIATQ